MAANLSLTTFPRIFSSHIAGLFGLAWDPFGAFANDTNVSTILSSASDAGAFVQSAANPASGVAASATSSMPGLGFVDHLEGLIQRLASFDGIFSYVASRWALSTLILSIVLNRAHVYASSRQHVNLSWQARAFLRLVPLLLLCHQTLAMLRTIRCQTGFQLPEIRFKDSDSVINRSWVHGNRGIYSVLSQALFWEETQDSCRAVNMIPPADGGAIDWQGSTKMLWPLFLVLSLSQFVETISSALQGRQPHAETGMTMFEHSMAFAEAETVTRTAVGLGLFGLPTSSSTPSNAARPNPSSKSGSSFTLTRAMLLSRLNVPPEVLLISLISACSHIANQLLGIFGLQARYRLANTSLWGILYLTLFVYSFANYAQLSSFQEMQKIRYPTVCIIGYLPHLLIAAGLTVCFIVYTTAVACTLLSAPTHWRDLSLWERIKLAHANMSASVSLSNIKIRPSEDFYTVLLKAGYFVMCAATEAVYFNEGVQVTMSSATWLDKAKAGRVPRGRLTQTPLELQDGFASGEGFGLIDEEPQIGPDGVAMTSGYAVERKTMKEMNRMSVAALKEEGVGISQRSGRWLISWKLIEQIGVLLGYCLARFTVSMMENLGGGQPPAWLLRLARVRGVPEAAEPGTRYKTLDFWMIDDAGELQLAQDANVDVEAETQKRLRHFDPQSDAASLDSTLYTWWKNGGWWGETDNSGDYRPEQDAADMDDTTSVISSASSTAWETDSAASNASDNSGAQTPTQASVASRSTALDADDTTAHLARLLDPQTLADRHEAKMLAHRLAPASAGPMTRARYRRSILRHRGAPSSSAAGALPAADEELVLEDLLASRRSTAAPGPARAGLAWERGGEGMGSAGPQCAVCQSAPRTVLVWPCRCLSLCEECRMSLAGNNFGSCVCCRRDVVAFSRLFVP